MVALVANNPLDNQGHCIALPDICLCRKILAPSRISPQDCSSLPIFRMCGMYACLRLVRIYRRLTRQYGLDKPRRLCNRG